MTMTKAPTHRLRADRCELGEGPDYDTRTNTAWWFDIVGRTLLEHRFATGETIAHSLPRMASVVARIDERSQLLAMEDGFYLRAVRDGGLTLLAPLEADNPVTRSNDGDVSQFNKREDGLQVRLQEVEMGQRSVWMDHPVFRGRDDDDRFGSK